MDWIDVAFRVWIVCGALAIIGGLLWDVYRKFLYKHSLFTLIAFVIVCLFLGPFALCIVIDVWLKHKKDNIMKQKFEVQVTVLFILECEPADRDMPSEAQIEQAIIDEFPDRDPETIDWRSTEEIR